MQTRLIGIDEVRSARRSILDGDPSAGAQLGSLAGRGCGSAAALKELGDLLLFCTAYPGSAEIAELARVALERTSESTRDLAAQSSAAAERLQDSGLAGSETIGCYSFSLVSWITRCMPEAIVLHSIDAPLEEIVEVLRPLLPCSIREVLELPYLDVEELLDSLFGNDDRKRLQGLLRLLETAECEDAVREVLFGRMQAYVRLRCGQGIPSLQELREESHPGWIHAKGILRHVDLAESIALGVGPPLALSRMRERHLIDRARLTLAIMQRETDPVTYAGAAELFEMGRGLRIALFHLEEGRRLTFDSYVGFMAYKNGLPIAYGGAWVFPGKTRIGINIFPYARGGESSWFFAQLLRLYKQRFDVRLFEAENYQLGHGNEDGLKSGAYWFYYRLGFRPWTENLSEQAAAEYERMLADKSYKTPLRLLKRLVADGLQLRVGSTAVEAPDTVSLLQCMAQHIVRTYSGDVKRAEAVSLRKSRAALGGKWSGQALETLRLWSLALDMIPQWQEWSAAERRALARIIRSKAGRTETEHQRLLLRHRRLLEAWTDKAGAL